MVSSLVSLMTVLYLGLVWSWNHVLTSVIKIEPKYNLTSMINHIMVVTTSCYCEWYFRQHHSYEKYIKYCTVVVGFLITSYLYELTMIGNDVPHAIHHIASIILMITCVAYRCWTIPWFTRIMFFALMGTFSSIISPLRGILRHRNAPLGYQTFVKYMYLLSYLACKLGGIVCFYRTLNRHWSMVHLVPMVCLMLYGIVHVVQLYFCSKVVLKLFTNVRASDWSRFKPLEHLKRVESLKKSLSDIVQLKKILSLIVKNIIQLLSRIVAMMSVTRSKISKSCLKVVGNHGASLLCYIMGVHPFNEPAV